MDKHCKFVILIASIISYISLNNAISASFDCEKASTSIEKKICSNEVLSSLDSSMALLYKIKRDNNLTKSQREWIKTVRNKTTNTDELIVSYADRIKYLSQYDISSNHSEKINTKVKDKKELNIQDFAASYVTIEGMQYSTNKKDINKLPYISECTDLLMIDVMNIWKQRAKNNNQTMEFGKYKNNIYIALWNSTSDKLESQLGDSRMRMVCDLLIAGTR